jgi:hypothetical protein
MNFLLPTFLGAAALIGLPALLHLLRLQPRTRIPFPSLRFLGRDALRDSRRHRIRRWLTFFLRCLIILLFVGAFSRPYWLLEHTTTSRAVVVVVDNSYSMQAAGRAEAVQAWLAPQIAALRPPDQLGVVVLCPTPEWLAPLGPDLEAGRRALAKVQPTFEISRFRAGLDLAATALTLAATKGKQILFASDEQRLGWSEVRFDRPLPPGVELVAAPAPNPPKHQAAVTSLKATRTAEGKLALEAAAVGYAAADEQRTMTFFLGDRALGTTPCRIGGGRTQVVHADYVVPEINEALMLRAVLDADELPLDDVAYAVLPAANDRRVMVAPLAAKTAVDFLGFALQAAHGGKLAALRVSPLPAPGAPWPVTSVALLRGAAPFRAAARPALDAFITAGGSAWIICDGSPEQAAWLAGYGVSIAPARPTPVLGLKLRDLALDHGLFAPFEGHSIAPLLAPSFRRGWALSGSALEPLARWSDRTIAIAEVSTGLGRLLITGFGETRDDSTFPIGAAYVPFVHQAIVWLAENKLLVPDGGRVGETLALPGAGTWRPLVSPVMGDSIAVNGVVTPAAPGIYEFDEAGVKRRYAVNLDPVESDLAPWPTPADFTLLVSKEPPPAPVATDDAGALRAPPAVIAEQLVDERGAWWWLVAAVVVLLFLEFGLANRTIP